MNNQTPTIVNNYYATGSDGTTSSPVETPVSDLQNPESEATENGTDLNALDSFTSAKGAQTKTGDKIKEVESSDNTGLIVALVATGAAAAAATGAYLYTKNQED